MDALEILYQDEYLVAINKPHDLLVHRSSIASEVSEFAVQILRDQLGRYVYPAHRLDRKTSGVLLFALQKQSEIMMQKQFQEKLIDKRYIAMVRGYTLTEQEVDYPLKKENGVVQDAFTRYKTLVNLEVDVPLGKHATSRYSIVEANPVTGRMHQLRKHFSHIFHPIIGDTTHGCNKQNNLFRSKWQMDNLLLHAHQLNFIHPLTGQNVNISARFQLPFLRILDVMKWPVTALPASLFTIS
jgi:tRNA pseudouridine65 synthase